VADDIAVLIAGGASVTEAVDAAVEAGVDVVPSSISTSCTCADWDDVCKHAVAVLLAFADEVAFGVDALLSWREIDVSAIDSRSVSAGEVAEAPSGAALARALLERLNDERNRQSRETPTGRRLSLVRDEPDELDPFYVGAMPSSGAVLAGVPKLTALANPFRAGALLLDNVDAGVVLADAMATLAAELGSRW
jgi:hypothetical protein